MRENLILNSYTGLIKFTNIRGENNTVTEIKEYIHDNSYIIIPDSISINITQYKEAPITHPFLITDIWSDTFFNTVIFNVPNDIKLFIHPFCINNFSISDLSLNNTAIFYSEYSNFSQSLTSIKLITQHLIHNTYSITNNIVTYKNYKNIFPGYSIIPEYCCAGSLLFSSNNLPIGFITIKNNRYYIFELKIIQSLIERYTKHNTFRDTTDKNLSLTDDVNAHQNRVPYLDLNNASIIYFKYNDTQLEFSLLDSDFIQSCIYSGNSPINSSKNYIYELYNKNYNFLGYFYFLFHFKDPDNNIISYCSHPNSKYVAMSRLYNTFNDICKNNPIPDYKTIKILENTTNYNIKFTKFHLNSPLTKANVYSDLNITLPVREFSYLGFTLVDIKSLNVSNCNLLISSYQLTYENIKAAINTGIKGYIITEINQEFKDSNGEVIYNLLLNNVILDYNINETILDIYLLDNKVLRYWEYDESQCEWIYKKQTIIIPQNILENISTI